MKKPELEILAWHFGADDKRLNYGKRSKVVAGRWMKARGKLVICANGMHASRDPFDALEYAQGSILSRVVCRGEIQEQSDKVVCRERKHLWQYDASKELRLYACWSARQVWHLLTDERSRNAVVVAERFAEGKATEEELSAARDAARDAAWAAARDAARDAAWAAARDAAWAAARDAAWDTARDAAWDAQRKHLNVVVAEIAARVEGQL